MALNIETGDILWQSPVPSEVLSIPAISKNVVIVRTSDGSVIGLNEKNGGKLWHYEYSGRWLYDNPDYSFSSIHWQLDANFADDFSHRQFAGWVTENYNPGIIRLIQLWVDHMETDGTVLRWYPFLDPMEDLLHGRQSLLRCGSGYANYSIMTDGHIAPCPVMIGMSQYYVGHIKDADPLNLPVIEVNGDCYTL